MKHGLDCHTCGTYTRSTVVDGLSVLCKAVSFDDEFSRLLPGTKDFVNVYYEVHYQKRLSLCNLKVKSKTPKLVFPNFVSFGLSGVC